MANILEVDLSEEGIDRLHEFLPELEKEVMHDLVDAAEFAVNMAKSLCPVDTGTLQSSIRYEVLPDGVVLKAGGSEYINPKTKRPCDYAPYVENRTPFIAPALDAIRDFIRNRLEEKGIEVSEVNEMSTDLTYTAIVKTDYANMDIRYLEIALGRFMSIIKRITGKDNLPDGIEVLGRFILIARMATTTAYAFAAVQGPIGWFFAATSLFATATSIATLQPSSTQLYMEMQ
jgi:hypothetical protein